MIPGKPKHIVDIGRMIVVLAVLFLPFAIDAQVGPDMRSAPSLHVFGTYTYGSSDWSSNSSEGFSLGGFLQTPHLWGLESRGGYLHWGTNEFRYDALAGPRIAFHFARFSPYGAVLAGVGHPVVRKNAQPDSHYQFAIRPSCLMTTYTAETGYASTGAHSKGLRALCSEETMAYVSW
jgi:hypothetical protein